MWVRQEVRMTPPPNMVRQENRVTMVGVFKSKNKSVKLENMVFKHSWTGGSSGC